MKSGDEMYVNKYGLITKLWVADQMIYLKKVFTKLLNHAHTDYAQYYNEQIRLHCFLIVEHFENACLFFSNFQYVQVVIWLQLSNAQRVSCLNFEYSSVLRFGEVYLIYYYQ